MVTEGDRRRLGEPLGNVAYHVRQLTAQGVLRLAREEPIRGSVQHFYELAALTAAPAADGVAA